MNIGGVEISWLGHAGFLIKNSKVIYVDPYRIKEGLPKADLILITHGHYDHCSFEDIDKIIQKGTKIVLTADAQSKIARFQKPIRMELAEAGQEFDFGEVKLNCIPAYNVDKPFHGKSEGLIGYVIKMDNVIVYHSGDTDVIPEMQKLTGYKQPNKTFVALLPVGGRFTMNQEEALEAVKIIKPSLVIPMHWGSIVGSEENAKEFKELCEAEGFKCEILEKE